MAYYESPEFTGEITENRICWEAFGEIVYLEPYGENAIRFRGSKSLRIQEDLNWNLLPPADAPAVQVWKSEREATMVNGKIKVTISGDGTVTYYRTATDEILLQESWIDGREQTAPHRRAREYKTLAGDEFRLELYFKANDGEHFYGMGEDANDCFDLKGTTINLFQKNGKCTIPYVYSSRGYGFIWNNPAIGKAEFVRNQTCWIAECAKQMDYIIIAEDTPDQVNRIYTDITGRAPMLPTWASGFWQCKLRYESQEELLSVAREYKRRNLPVSVIVIDFFHWTMQGDWKFDPEKWPDPKAMVEELEEMGIRLVVSIWPTVDTRSENYKYMKMHNYMLRAEKGIDAFFMFYGAENHIDVTHPGARKFLWKKVRENYYSYGIKNFWLDEAEPEMRPYDFDNVRMYKGNAQEVGNLYCADYAKAFYDGMTELGEETCNLVRCAWLGSQRYGIVLWSGDIASTFESLRKQVKVGLSVSLCGIPWWTTDIGGFVNGDPSDESFRELLVRWFAFGVFCPIFRLHGFRLPVPSRDIFDPDGYCASGGDNEVWSFGDNVYEILVKYMHMREKLRPYIMEHMKIASETGRPMMRPLFYDFPEDKNCYQVEDAYLFGPDLLVAPVTGEGETEKTVYLPKGAVWTAADSKIRYPGGQTITVSADLASIPVFYKNDADFQLF